MKKTLCAMVCVISSFLYAAEQPQTNQNSISKTSKIPLVVKSQPSNQNSISKTPSCRIPLVAKSGPKLDSDPINSTPINSTLQRVRSQSLENQTFVHEENAKKIYPYHATTEEKK